jgi:hypothetical protein
MKPSTRGVAEVVAGVEDDGRRELPYRHQHVERQRFEGIRIELLRVIPFEGVEIRNRRALRQADALLDREIGLQRLEHR